MLRRRGGRLRQAARTLTWLAALAGAGAAATTGCSENRSGYGRGQVTILFTNSLRGQTDPFFDGTPGGLRGGLAERATLVGQVRAALGASSVLLVDVGDLLGASTTTLDRVSRGAAGALAMNAMGYHAAAVGAGDFSYGLRSLVDLAAGPDVRDFAGASLFPRAGGDAFDFTSGMAFPMVATNLVDGATSAVPSGLVEGPVIFRLGGVRIGLIAVCATTTPDQGRPPSSLAFRDPIAVASAAVQALGARVDLVVVLSSQSDAADAALLAQVPEIDVLIGGGDGAFDGIFTRGDALTGGQAVPTGLQVTVGSPDGVYVRTETLGRTVGRLDLRVEGGVITVAEITHLETQGVAPDPVVDAILQPFRQERDQAASLTLQTVLGSTTGALDGTVSSVRATETAWGDLVADAVRDATSAEVAFVHAGVFHGAIEAGSVTTGQVFDALPTRERVATTTLTGSELLAVLEHAVASVPGEAFLQVAGLSFRWDAALASGSRVIASSVKIAGVPLVTTQTYSVAVPESVAAGGDGFSTFSGASTPLLGTETIASLVVTAVRAQTPLSPAVAGRITRDN